MLALYGAKVSSGMGALNRDVTNYYHLILFTNTVVKSCII